MCVNIIVVSLVVMFVYTFHDVDVLVYNLHDIDVCVCVDTYDESENGTGEHTHIYTNALDCLLIVSIT